MKAKTFAAALLLMLASACSNADESAGPPPAMPVTVATPLVREVVDWDDFVGRFEAVQNVEVRPRVSGYLQGVHFRDGQFVQKGQLLFTIDPRPAQAALDQARAQVARAQATLANGRTELARSRTLAEARAASQEEVEARQAAVRAGEADVAAAQAAVRAAQLNVGFTRVTAPIAGRVSERLVDAGNSVAADQTVLTTIVSTQPIHFAFEGSEALLLKYQRQNEGTGAGTEVRIRLSDEATYSRSGRLDFVNNVVSTGSGTVRLRAIVPNPDNFLKPGMFGHLRLAGTQPYRAMLIPDTAIVTDAARKVVYTVAKDGTVAAKPVDLGPLMGSLRVVRGGIAPNERVIISGLQRAQPGQKVQPKPGKIEAPADTAPPAPESLAAPASIATPAGK